MFSAKDIATELNTDPKTLRRFLRQDPQYRNPGSGGRWMFTEDDVQIISKRFGEWQGRPHTSASGKTLIEDVPGLEGRVIRSKTRTDRAAVRAITEARVNRLEAALKAKGLHISQMQDRDYTGRSALASQ
ncbi:MAG: hypothetical protein AB7L09_22300 [Nitrospira sp.]